MNKLLSEFLGNTPHAKVLSYFLDYDNYDHSKTDISKETEVSRTTLHRIIKDMIDLGIIVKTRTVGMATMYIINNKNTVVKKLFDVEKELVINELSKTREIPSKN
ncbi:hypothetical protein COT72_00070 [archaeon CG10_big_fil_rev_8_21_14_0_10_43_11]|nr:MAG: hypothetical protein COT72_00070 [archaeon CG10_big_fil_rev_8_21_14_0_10_43_11]